MSHAGEARHFVLQLASTNFGFFRCAEVAVGACIALPASVLTAPGITGNLLRSRYLAEQPGPSTIAKNAKALT